MRNEYPRPIFKRDNWVSLNGEWDFIFDDENKGIDQQFFRYFPKESLKINVPFAYQTKLSGINERTKHDVIWYRKKVMVNSKTRINFQAVDYSCSVYVNGDKLLDHTGGSTPFSVDVPEYLNGEVDLVVRCFDPLFDESIPRGKQFWEEKSRGIWYTPTSGIWQSVWTEEVNKSQITQIFNNSDVDNGYQYTKVITSDSVGKKLKFVVTFEGEVLESSEKLITNNEENFVTDVYRNKIFNYTFHDTKRDTMCWSPERPVLFDVEISILDDEQICDKVDSYFGFRKIETKNGMTYLNNRPYYQKLVLDQGYWIDGLLTAPSDEDFKQDIILSKEMGFNGCRKHQKVEDPRFLYWADKLGYLVWGEVEAPAIFNSNAVEGMQKLWFDIIKRDYNHPCIVAWVPMNESWGVPNISFDDKQQSHSLSLYYQIKSIDNTRLVVNNDGWECTKTDICAIHNYNHGAIDDLAKHEVYRNTLKTKDNMINSFAALRNVYADGFEHCGEPILLTEFGGVAYDVNTPDGWGYTSVRTGEELLSEYKRIMTDIFNSEAIFGYCYTQLTDVEQEVNGLLTYDRKPKCDLAQIKEINDCELGMKKPIF